MRIHVVTFPPGREMVITSSNVDSANWSNYFYMYGYALLFSHNVSS
jgi:hypothetical protein